MCDNLYYFEELGIGFCADIVPRIVYHLCRLKCLGIGPCWME